MTVELLAIVQAEEQADALLKEAQDRKERAIKRALDDRQAQLSSITMPPPSEPKLKALNPNLEKLKATARKNKAKAVKAILEGLHVQD